MSEKIKVRSLYHKPIGERGVGKAIVVWTWLLGLFYNRKVLKYNYSHEEFWLPDEKGEFGWIKRINGKRNSHLAIHQTLFKGQCFSSTTRGDADGVRFADAWEVLHHPERWDYIEFEVDEGKFKTEMRQAASTVGAKYDYLGIFGFLNPFPTQNPDKWYCSEICCAIKWNCGIHKRFKRISPRRSAYVLAKKYHEPKPLIRETC